MVGNLTNLNLSVGPLSVGKNWLSLGLSALAKLDPTGKEPVGMSARTMAKRFLIAKMRME